jgi:hypothetical protein
MSDVFAETVAALAATLGSPTDRATADRWTSRRAAWAVEHRRADNTRYGAHVAVVDEERGVIVYAHRRASICEFVVNDVVIAPSRALLSRIGSDTPIATTAAEVFSRPWRPRLTIATPAAAIECALALAATEDTPLPGDDIDEAEVRP